MQRVALQGKIIIGDVTLTDGQDVRVDISAMASFSPDRRAILGVGPLVVGIDTVTIGGTLVEGELFTVTLDGVGFTVTAPATPTATEVRDLLRTALTASGLATIADVSTDALSITALRPGHLPEVEVSSNSTAGGLTRTGTFTDADEFGLGVVQSNKSGFFRVRTDGDTTATFHYAVIGG